MKNILTRFRKSIVLLAVILAGLLTMGAACGSNADTVSENISVAAENFEVQRKIVGTNTILGTFVFEVEGKCSIERIDVGGHLVLQAVCKHGPDDYKRHEIGLADNVTYVAMQVDGLDVNEYSTRVELRPQAIVPDINFNVGQGNGK